jgi:predicted phosphodiesterase
VRVAVLSDIHANYHALEAVLEEVSAESPDELWCLGDVVGYGPEPNRCCELARERFAVCLAGNHDLAVLGELRLEDFNAEAAAAARWTQGVLTAESEAFLRGLRPWAHREDVALVHGSPIDPVWDYVLSEDSVRRSLAAVAEPLLLVGHSHLPIRIRSAGGMVNGGLARAGDQIDLTGARWLLNPGSVGQPRGGDPRAAWLLLDLDAGRASFRRTTYPVARTQAEIRAAGLPDSLAARLPLGQ